MISEKQQNPNFFNLWPSIFMRHVLPGCEVANVTLTTLIEHLDLQDPNTTTDYLKGNLMEHSHPAIQWLKNSFQYAVLDYARHIGIDYQLDFSIQGWPNINKFGDYHSLHNHPHSWLSGTYYIKVPQIQVDLPGRNDRDPNAISFFDPRPQANMLAIKSDPNVDPEFRIQPTAGELLIWPSFIHHFVHPNLSNENRISLSFNIILRWKDSYIPK